VGGRHGYGEYVCRLCWMLVLVMAEKAAEGAAHTIVNCVRREVLFRLLRMLEAVASSVCCI
jgi:hypothetical protein